jgi:hypothetical protein
VWQSRPAERLDEIPAGGGYVKAFPRRDARLAHGTAPRRVGRRDHERRSARGPRPPRGGPARGGRVHAIGDRANRDALDAFEASAPAWRPLGLRPRIEHAQCVHPADVPRFARLGVTASVQYTHATSDRDLAERLWADRIARAYPYRSLHAAGTRLAGGSDAPVEPLSPLAGVRAAVARTADDRPAWHPEQALDVDPALESFTSTPAWLEHAEARRGACAPASSRTSSSSTATRTPTCTRPDRRHHARRELGARPVRTLRRRCPKATRSTYAANRMRPILAGRVPAIALRIPGSRATAGPSGWRGARVEAVDAHGKHLFVRFEGEPCRPLAPADDRAWATYREGSAGAGRRGAPGSCSGPPPRGRPVRRPRARAADRVAGPLRPAPGATRTGHPRAELDEARFLRRLREDDPTRPIGDALLDQRTIAGLGNLWKCEGASRPGSTRGERGRRERRGGARDRSPHAAADAGVLARRQPDPLPGDLRAVRTAVSAVRATIRGAGRATTTA